MKRTNLIILSALCLFTITCKKASQISGPLTSQALITQAQRYFTDSISSAATSHSAAIAQSGNYRTRSGKKVLWDLAFTADFQTSPAVWVPVAYEKPLFVRPDFGGDHYFNLDNLSYLLVYGDKKKVFHAELVTLLPDSNYVNKPTGRFSGYAFVEDWWGNTITRYHYTEGKTWKYQPPTQQALGLISICTVIYGYNYSPSTNDSYSWVETVGCTTAFIPDDSELGLAGGYTSPFSGGTRSKPSLQILVGHNIISNIHSYFNCFQNVPDATYQVTVYADQPTPGSRTPWNWSLNTGSSSGENPINPGHTFLQFKEIYGNNTIARNIGFYPATDINPFFVSTAQGALNNDESHQYNISAQFQVNSSSFFAMLAYAAQGNNTGYNYDLNTNNCTTFALNTLSVGHIYLPSTIGYWLTGMGNDPGDFGEDLRNSNAPGIMKSTTEAAHPNTGSCN